MTPSPPRRSPLSLLGSALTSQSKPASQPTLWDELCSRIKEGAVIPIIGNGLYGDGIFRPLFDKILPEPSPLTVDELLAEEWAARIGYPLADRQSLPRVAQFNRLKQADDLQAKRAYLSFLKSILLDVIQQADPGSADLVATLRNQTNEQSFRGLVGELDLNAASDTDPLRLLARLNLPIYVTTSAYDFLERAILAEGRTPSTQICGEISNLQPEHQLPRDFQPSAAKPVVYHLHGLESYPASLVLSEDDYLKFLVRVTQPTDPEKPVIPLYLSEKLAESTLLLLGYRLQDWDFRATFRGLITVKDAPLRSFSLAIQLDPKQQGDVSDPEAAQRYLEDYFRSANFRVEWSNPVQFMQKLWGEWNRWRQGGQA